MLSWCQGCFLVCLRAPHQRDNERNLDSLVSISKAAKLLLPGSVPAVEADAPPVGEKVQRVNFHANGGCIQQASYDAPSQISLLGNPPAGKAPRTGAESGSCGWIALGWMRNAWLQSQFRKAVSLGRKLTLIALLKLPRQVPLHESRLACQAAWERTRKKFQ